MKRTHLTLAAMLLVVALPGLAQFRVQPLSGETGEVGLGLLLRRLGTVGVFMQATAHPDDEDNGLLALYGRGLGYRTVLATATRGDGGQNEIGPELFEALGVLRTNELQSMHWFDGAEQYFTRAVDFGYSFSLEETFEKWGREEIAGDFVRLIRTVRPDVIAALPPQGAGGGQHHQASAQISREAFDAAADPARYPEQLREGLRPWRAKKFYFRAGFGPGAGRGGGPLCTIDTGVFDALVGKTYAELGAEARSMHKCQGFGQLLPVPGLTGGGRGVGASRYQLAESVLAGGAGAEETSLFDGIDTSLGSLAKYAEAPPPSLVAGLAAISAAVADAKAALGRGGPEAAGPALASGLSALRALRARLAAMGLDEPARYEIDLRLAPKEEDFQRALLLAHGIRVETLADDGVVIAGQSVRVSAIVAVRSRTPVSVRSVSFGGFEGDGGCAPGPVADGLFRCEAPRRIPAGARVTAPYWRRHPRPEVERYEFDADVPFGVPFRPTPFRVALELDVNGTSVRVDRPVESRYEGNVFSGEKRMELHVVPALAVKLTPEIAIIPSRDGAVVSGRELRVTVTNSARGAAAGDVRLALPAGWRAEPGAARLEFTREDEALTARFTVTAAPRTAAGAYRIRAVAETGGRSFDRGYQVVEYPHVERRHLDVAAEATLKVIDVRVAPDLRVGYIMGVGDQVPPAIEQIGARLSFIDRDELAWGDLSRYDAIVTGVRAYERRDDLRAGNARLLEYVRQGGTLIVQYNKLEFNEAQYGPYPARVSNDRVTDEFSPVTPLDPAHPLFSFPNRITGDTWAGWVQERGLYFLGERDPRYVDLLSLDEKFPFNQGTKRGALVEARVGRGRWVYVGLGLWRQLPAGTDGAYQLLANLISLGKAPQ